MFRLLKKYGCDPEDRQGGGEQNVASALSALARDEREGGGCSLEVGPLPVLKVRLVDPVRHFLAQWSPADQAGNWRP